MIGVKGREYICGEGQILRTKTECMVIHPAQRFEGNLVYEFVIGVGGIENITRVQV